MTTTPTSTTTPAMPAASGSGSSATRPDGRAVRDLIWRVIVIDAAAVGVVLDLPVWARLPLSLLAVLVVVQFFLRRARRRGAVDGLLTAVGVAVVVVILLGVVLDLLPSGITGPAWGIGTAAVELAFLFALAYGRLPAVSSGRLAGWRRRPPVAAVVWTVLIGGVLASALVWATSSYSSTHVAPVSLGAVTSSTSAVVTVSSGKDAGPYELRSVAADGVITVLFRDIEVGPGASASFKVVTPKNTRATIELVKSGESAPVRELILDTHAANTKVNG